MSFKSLISPFLLSVLYVSCLFAQGEESDDAGDDGQMIGVEENFDNEPLYADEQVEGEFEGDVEGALEEERTGPGFVLFEKLEVDLNASTAFIHDSNTTQTAIAQSASLFAFSYGANVRSGKEGSRGGYYGFNYRGQAFIYADSASQAGRDPFENYLGGYVGVNGGKTKIRANGGFYRNNGNSLQFDEVQRETRRAASNDYNFDLSIVRDISRVSLELATGYNLRDFDGGSGVSDGETTYGDVAGFVTPSFAPKTNVGGGVRFGSDIFEGSPQQDFFTPSVRWRYRYSSKTSLFTTVGQEIRSVEGLPGGDSENLVYNGGIDWAFTPKTRFNLGYYRRVQPSYVTLGQDVNQSGVTFQMSNRLPGRFQLSTQVGLENADYSADQVGGGVLRDDKFVRLGLDLSHPLMITERLLGEWSIFFNYNQNDSTLADSSFEQNVVGVRVGLVY